jgi:hypothetical protein
MDNFKSDLCSVGRASLFVTRVGSLKEKSNLPFIICHFSFVISLKASKWPQVCGHDAVVAVLKNGKWEMANDEW